ncbi:CidA/LrgA family protein [Cohnella hashimotonis]|uniref:CidA/LrgA family protein n=1 Tax=Cohnella hashimotonis TaxID=2826895 RepID=A0ABT6TAN4_9BACL|nr:CidA/LrgA family protein [Cohnella hashimotonis]MDI4643829.1 CidA/LrgA family protein [Cohnella hashimotonis]
MTGFAILLGFNLLGLVAEHVLHLPIPGNVIGLILFTAALFLRIVKLEWVERSAELLTRHMMLFFVPYIVGTIAFLPVLRENGLAIAVSLAGSTLIVMLVAGSVAARVGRKASLAPESEQGKASAGL